MKRCAWLLAGLLLLAATANAQVTCNRAGTQSQMNACAVESFKQADAELNRVYALVRRMQQGDSLSLQRLRDAQRIWVQLRDADVAARYPVPDDGDYRMSYGSQYPQMVNTARAEATRARTAWLQEYFLETEVE